MAALGAAGAARDLAVSTNVLVLMYYYTTILLYYIRIYLPASIYVFTSRPKSQPFSLFFLKISANRYDNVSSYGVQKCTVFSLYKIMVYDQSADAFTNTAAT